MKTFVRLARILVLAITALALAATADAQFKVVGPAPLPPAEARQKIKTLLANVDSSNSKQTADTISGLLTWYRDIVDEELIAAWKGDGRANLTQVMGPLASEKVATGVIEFSWREARQETFNLTYAPIFGDLMARYPASAKPFLDDLLVPAQRAPVLPDSVAKAVCRILVDMPDIESWKSNALQILPNYRRAAEAILYQDLRGPDPEKSYQAQVWLTGIKSDVPSVGNEQPSPRRKLSPPQPPVSQRPTSAAPPVATSSGAPTLRRAPESSAQVSTAPAPYSGPMSGTLTCSSATVPQNAEHVFLHVPMVKLQFDYDTRIWDVRLVPGDGQTQKLIVKNISSGPQKRCVVHWNVIP